MKFGIYIPNLEEKNPSGASFEQATLRELIKVCGEHSLFVFTKSNIKSYNRSGLTYVNVNEYRLGTLRKIVYKLFSILFFLLLKIYPSGKIKQANFFLKNELDTTPLNRAIISNRIRLIWHTFSAERIDIPYIYGVLDCNHWIHSYQPEFSPSSFTWSSIDINFSNVIRQATYIVASTEVLKNQIMKIHGVLENKIRVIPFFTPEISNTNSFIGAPESLIEDLPERFLFYPARLMSQKNHATILYSLEILKRKYKVKIPIVLVGKDGGNKRYILSLIDKLALNEDVIYLGEVSFESLLVLYKKAFALVYASMNGPDNFPPLEAFSLGCPVIASRLEGAEEQLGDNALYFDTTNEEELADRIYELYSDEDLRSRLIERGYIRSRKWTANDYAIKLLSIVNEFDKLSRSWDEDFMYISKRWNLLMR